MMTEREMVARATRGYQDEVGLDYRAHFEMAYGEPVVMIETDECDECGLGHPGYEDCAEAVALAKLEGGR
jgi:hypothetical protein